VSIGACTDGMPQQLEHGIGFGNAAAFGRP
jgi:hypothetical protein